MVALMRLWLHHQRFTCKFVHDIEQLDRQAVLRHIGLEIEGPQMTGPLQSAGTVESRAAGACGASPRRPPSRDNLCVDSWCQRPALLQQMLMRAPIPHHGPRVAWWADAWFLFVRTLLGMDLAPYGPVAHSRRPEDRSLWDRSLGGDGDAFGILFDRHRDRVFRHASLLARSRQEAEDVAASAFLELWRRRKDVRLIEGSVLPWLLVTTTNLGRNAARSTFRYRQLLERLPRAPDQPDVADTVLGTRALGVDGSLRVALRSLNKTDAQLFALVALEGYSVADAAECLCLSVSAAQTRLHRTRRQLRAQLGGALDMSSHTDERTYDDYRHG